MSIAPHPDPENLAELLHSTAIRLLRTLRRVDESSGLTAPRLSALSVIVFNGPITLGKLAEAEQVRPPTMTRIVNALEEQKLVVKAQDPGDVDSFGSLRLLRGRECLSEVVLDGSNLLPSRYGTWRRLNRRTCLLPWSRFTN